MKKKILTITELKGQTPLILAEEYFTKMYALELITAEQFGAAHKGKAIFVENHWCLMSKKVEASITQNSNTIRIGIVVGSKFGKATIEAEAEIRKQHFTPRLGWELKDCIIIGLPQQYRFCVLNDYEMKQTSKGLFAVLWVKR